MSGPIPYLGSKISLISKSEIRYEGILYTIDAQESVIALAKVRSFGTEDRPAPTPVSARDDVYEYIIFRGTDIKKIEVCDTPKQQTLPGGLYNDPAIVQHSAPSIPTSFQAAPFSRQSLGTIGSGTIGSASYDYNQTIGQQTLPGASGTFPVGTSTSQTSEFRSEPPVVGGGSGSSIDAAPGSLPIPIGGPSQLHQKSGLLADMLSGSRSSTPTARKSPVSDAGVQVSPPSKDEKKESAHREERSSQEGQSQMKKSFGSQQSKAQFDRQQYGTQNQQYYGQNNYYQYKGGAGRGRGVRRAQSRGRGAPSYSHGSNQRHYPEKQILADYDFETANEEFEELRSKFAKAKITENGEKNDSGHETAGGEESDDTGAYYDKAKSFFDSISCEALERSKGRSQRPDWRMERKINVETFGVSSPRRGYYTRGRGGYFRGSSSGGGGNYYRGYGQSYFRGFRGGRGQRSSMSNGGYSQRPQQQHQQRNVANQKQQHQQASQQ